MGLLPRRAGLADEAVSLVLPWPVPVTLPRVTLPEPPPYAVWRDQYGVTFYYSWWAVDLVRKEAETNPGGFAAHWLTHLDPK